jgi:hypothetical protein
MAALWPILKIMKPMIIKTMSPPTPAPTPIPILTSVLRPESLSSLDPPSSTSSGDSVCPVPEDADGTDEVVVVLSPDSELVSSVDKSELLVVEVLNVVLSKEDTVVDGINSEVVKVVEDIDSEVVDVVDAVDGGGG